MVIKMFRALCVAISITFGLGLLGPSAAHAFDRDMGYGAFHAHKGACDAVYAAAYRKKRSRYYSVHVRPGRYVWRTRRIRVGSIRRRGRTVPHYRTVRKRVLVRPVRYRVRKRHGAGRWVSEAVVVKGRPRLRRHRRSC